MFKVYNAFGTDDDKLMNDRHLDTSDMEQVASGLSSGELCQYLIDVLREAVEGEEIFNLRTDMERFGLEFEDDALSSRIRQESTLETIESTLYELDEDDMSGRGWISDQETLYVEYIND